MVVRIYSIVNNHYFGRTYDGDFFVHTGSCRLNELLYPNETTIFSRRLSCSLFAIWSGRVRFRVDYNRMLADFEKASQETGEKLEE